MVVPRVLGGDSLTVLSGSMEPTFSPGDVVVVKGVTEAEVCSDVSVGSIVTYFPEPNDPTLITHRVIGKTIGTFEDGTSCRLITQGDANTVVDEPISPAQVRGVFMYGVPGIWSGAPVGSPKPDGRRRARRRSAHRLVADRFLAEAAHHRGLGFRANTRRKRVRGRGSRRRLPRPAPASVS